MFIKIKLFPTFRRTIGSGNDNNSFHEQILKKLLQNHGISDISDLCFKTKYLTQNANTYYLVTLIVCMKDAGIWKH